MKLGIKKGISIFAFIYGLLFLCTYAYNPNWALILSQIFIFMAAFLFLFYFKKIEIKFQNQLRKESKELEAKQAQRNQDIAFINTHLKPKHPLPSMDGFAITPDFAVKIIQIIEDQQPATIVEASSGISTIISGYCTNLLGKGKVYSLEHEKEYAELSTKNLSKHKPENCQVFHAPLKEYTIKDKSWQWYDIECLKSIPSIDLLIIDGPPRKLQEHARYPALPLLMDKLSPKCTILLDDAARDSEKGAVQMWLDEFPEFKAEYISNEKGLSILTRS